MTIKNNAATTVREPLTSTDLPIDVLPRILAKSSGGTVLNLALHSRVFHAAAKREETWKRLHDAGSWKPCEGVRDIIEAGSYREAFQVEVKDAKGTWEKLETRARATSEKLRNTPCQTPINRSGCFWGSAVNTRNVYQQGRELANIRKEQAAILQAIESDYLAFVPEKDR